MPLVTPSIVAHRGLHDLHPENSLASFKAAWTSGVLWCECDIHCSADGIAIVIHDDTLDRTTNGCGDVATTSSKALQRVKLTPARGGKSDQTIPLLRDVLEAMPAQAGLIIEIKPIIPEDQVRAILRLLSGRRAMLQSFHTQVLETIRRCDNDISLAWLIEQPEQLAEAVSSDWRAIHLKHTLLDVGSHAQLRQARKKIGVWTVNTEVDAKRILALGVETLITDDPAVLRGLIQ